MDRVLERTIVAGLVRRLEAMAGAADADAPALPLPVFERDLLMRVHAMPFAFFERLVIDLLIAMGCGTSAVRLGRSGDQGIDGVVRRDALGLDAVYFQAKRYRLEATAPAGHVRDFAGSLDAVRATRGVFITTARVSAASREFAARVTRHIVLVDGAELARLLIAHRIGVIVRDTVVVAGVDEDYFSGKARPETISASIQPRK